MWDRQLKEYGADNLRVWDNLDFWMFGLYLKRDFSWAWGCSIGDRHI